MVHEYRNIFSKTKLERMSLQKPYDYAIEFDKSAILPKPVKVYLLSVSERSSLDLWIDEKLRKGYI